MVIYSAPGKEKGPYIIPGAKGNCCSASKSPKDGYPLHSPLLISLALEKLNKNTAPLSPGNSLSEFWGKGWL